MERLLSVLPKPGGPTREYVRTYVYSTGTHTYDADFLPVIDRVRLCPLPEAILRAHDETRLLLKTLH